MSFSSLFQEQGIRLFWFWQAEVKQNWLDIIEASVGLHHRLTFRGFWYDLTSEQQPWHTLQMGILWPTCTVAASRMMSPPRPFYLAVGGSAASTARVSERCLHPAMIGERQPFFRREFPDLRKRLLPF
mmetsp:Transcript_11583/g.17437  ORF Transcript_11583/g.17437 Transcript_11583/m.17437 type:complete len:128 (+) Transcript_11583:886-1269(+)